ncbi:MAG: acyltransferase family protein [Actinomycetota bacterium]
MSRSPRTIAYQPALDGLRAVAVALVLVFHGGFTWMSGGYVGVSVFFTLSGYLITTLLLVEHQRNGELDLAAFYARRMKRLLPASLAVLASITLLAGLGAFRWDESLRRDLLGSLFQVENWVKLVGKASYADLTNATFGRVGPLEHYWSLAIEEQFYWVWPLTMLGLVRLTRRWRNPTRARCGLIVTMAVFAVASAPLIAHHWGPNVAYWATPARIGEILVGAALAAILHVRSVDLPGATWVGSVCLAVVVWAATTWASGSGLAYQGWLGVFAVATAGLIWALRSPGPLRAAFSWRPLVFLGTISYGIYLYHWPVFALVTSNRFGGLGRAPLFALRVAITLALSVVSYRLLEQPVRRRELAPRRVAAGAGALTAVLAAAIVVVVIPVPALGSSSITASGQQASAIEAVNGTLAPLATTGAANAATVTTVATVVGSPAGTVASNPDTTVGVPAVSRPVRIVVVGDSTAMVTGDGLTDWANDHLDVARVGMAAAPGCGFIRDGKIPTDGAIDFAGACKRVLDKLLPDVLAQQKPDVVMLMVSMRDVEDRMWNTSEGAISPFDPRFVTRLTASYTAMADWLIAHGVPRIAWVLAPVPTSPFGPDQRKMLDPARYEVQYNVIRSLAAKYPSVVRVVDLNAWLTSTRLTRDLTVRPDGLHWSPEAARWVCDTYLAGTVVSVAVS